MATATASAPAASPHTERPLLSEDQAARYARQGWTAAYGFFSPAQAADIARWTDELTSRPERPGAEMLYREASLKDPAAKVVQRVENFVPFHPAFDALVHGRLLEAAEALLGGPAVLFKDKINFKAPGGAGFEPHQDQQAGWSVFAPMFVTAMVAIDDATLENGCLEMADAPRLGGLIGEEWTPLTLDQMKAFTLIPAPTAPGDVLFFDSYAPHGSAPNMTDRGRRILYLTYNLASDGDHRARYYADKRASFPPDIEREPGREYRFRV